MKGEDLVLPDLGLDEPIALSLWLVKQGGRVVEGEPIVEVVGGEATVDLPAPADGVLVEKCAEEGDPLAIGQRLAVIELC
jgi:pyruvate dehydrogenase E2 component (dihydrolipoamide acetyltransferase)